MYLSFTVLICNFDKKKRGEVEERKHDEGLCLYGQNYSGVVRRLYLISGNWICIQM